jgi:Skp family chaperone for outer membrane proteins
MTNDKTIEKKEKEITDNKQDSSWKSAVSEINENIQNTEFDTGLFRVIQKIINAIAKLFKVK